MTDLELRFQYFLAHVRLHSLSDPNTWSPDDVMRAFYMLPAPAIDYEHWKKRMPSGMSTTEEDMQRSNEAAKGLSALEAHLEAPIEVTDGQ